MCSNSLHMTFRNKYDASFVETNITYWEYNRYCLEIQIYDNNHKSISFIVSMFLNDDKEVIDYIITYRNKYEYDEHTYHLLDKYFAETLCSHIKTFILQKGKMIVGI